MEDKFPCDECVVDAICQTPCIRFREYLSDRLIGLRIAPPEFVSTSQRFGRSVFAATSLNITCLIMALERRREKNGVLDNNNNL